MLCCASACHAVECPCQETSCAGSNSQLLCTSTGAQRPSRHLKALQVRYTLAVVRLADPTHCQLQSLNAATETGSFLPVCGPAAPAAAQASVSAAVAVAEAAASAPAPEAAAAAEAAAVAAAAEQRRKLAFGPCQANEIASLNVTSGTDYLSLHPGLRFPNIQVWKQTHVHTPSVSNPQLIPPGRCRVTSERELHP